MKRLLLLVCLLFVHPLSYAQEAKGVIEEIKICGTGLTSTTRWIRNLQFKVDGLWFGIYADRHADSLDRDNNITTSLLLMAYSQNLTIEVKATESWESSFKKCGNSQGAAFHGKGGDYIRLSR